MLRRVEYIDNTINNKSIAYDSFYHILLKTASPVIIDKMTEFYLTTPLTREMRYSGMHNKIISVK